MRSAHLLSFDPCSIGLDTTLGKASNLRQISFYRRNAFQLDILLNTTDPSNVSPRNVSRPDEHFPFKLERTHRNTPNGCNAVSSLRNCQNVRENLHSTTKKKEKKRRRGGKKLAKTRVVTGNCYFGLAARREQTLDGTLAAGRILHPRKASMLPHRMVYIDIPYGYPAKPGIATTT